MDWKKFINGMQSRICLKQKISFGGVKPIYSQSFPVIKSLRIVAVCSGRSTIGA